MATKLIVGLGNPGIKYRFTRHNIGFLVARQLAKKCSLSLRRKRFSSLLGEGVVDGTGVMLALPLTFMNLSGPSVCSLVEWKKLSLADLLVICDDVNLSLGMIRLRPGGGCGGHKGLSSIIDSLGTEDFPRLRIGIGGRLENQNLESFVLRPFHKKERDAVNSSIERAAEAVMLWVKQGIEVAMNKFNA